MFATSSQLGTLVLRATVSVSAAALQVQSTWAQKEGPTLNASDLISNAAPVRSFRAKDAFDTPPKVDLSGRGFAVELPVRAGGSGGCVSLPFWRYEAQSGKLNLIFFGAQRSGYFLKGYDGKVHPVLSEMGRFTHTAPVKCVEVAKGAYRASNLFGATTTIYRKAQSVVEIAVVKALGSDTETDFMMSSVDLPPAEARRIVPSLRVRYEGKLVNWENDSSVACGVQQMPVDMASAEDATIDTCIFRGIIERIAFVDGRSGKVLAERTLPTPATE